MSQLKQVNVEKNCYVDMTVNLNLEKDSKTFSVTAFPKAVSAFFYEDIFPSMTTMTLAS